MSKIHIVDDPKAVYLFQKLGIIPSSENCLLRLKQTTSLYTRSKPYQCSGKCWHCIELWLISRRWRQEQMGYWIDPTGLERLTLEKALGWQVWTDASVLFDRLGWGGRWESREYGDCRILGCVQVPHEISKKSRTIRCSPTKALEFYIENRAKAEALAKAWRKTGGRPVSGLGPYLPVSFCFRTPWLKEMPF